MRTPVRISVLPLLLICSQFVMAQSGTTTLYSINKYGGKNYDSVKRDFCLDFKKGASDSRRDPCDLRYGSLYAGDDWDWFQSSAHQGSRSVIKDLGPQSWDVAFNVPPVTPLPKLLPGEKRNITIDTSGADGEDGAPGAPGRPGADWDGVVRQRNPPATPQPPNQPAKKKKDGKHKIDPLFVKAIVGHMYVIRVVDDNYDFYALFRVETLERGDYCVVSWKMIDAPQENLPVGNNK